MPGIRATSSNAAPAATALMVAAVFTKAFMGSFRFHRHRALDRQPCDSLRANS
jgi:hypothetical protein